MGRSCGGAVTEHRYLGIGKEDETFVNQGDFSTHTHTHTCLIVYLHRVELTFIHLCCLCG